MNRERRSESLLRTVVMTVGLALVATASMTHDRGCTSSQPAAREDVTITTDRTDYRKGDTVTVKVRNRLRDSIWYLDAELGGRHPWWGIQRSEGGDWKEIALWKPVDGECALVVSEHVPIEELVRELGPDSERIDPWALANCVEISPVGPELQLQPVEPGNYRLLFTYGTDPSSWKDSTVYSGEFSVGGD
jgi:hypothetical protein